MSAVRVAIVFDDRLRPETTGTYCRRALQDLATVEHFLPQEVDKIPRSGVDLYLRIDDGLPCEWPADLQPAALWAIDTHLSADGGLAESASFEWVFTAQRDGAENLRCAGCKAVWLPLACDPGIHRPFDLPKTYDVGFIGNVFRGPREDLLALLQREFPSSFVGRKYFEEMARTYSQCRTVFNRSVGNDVNMRVFEVLGCRTLLVTNDLADNGQDELLQPGKHLVTYREPEELLDKVRFYVRHEGARDRVANAGHSEVVARHTYRHRMQAILHAINGNGRTSVPMPADVIAAPTAMLPIAAKIERIDDSDPHARVPSDLNLPDIGKDRQVIIERTVKPTAAVPEIASRASVDPHGRASANSPARDPSYFEFARPDVLAFVPDTARRILDIGCGGGRLGAALKERQGAHVTGIELDAGAAAAARTRLDAVHEGNLEFWTPPFSRAQFDCVIAADVLEHLRAPQALLCRIHEWLAPNGTLVLSIPNSRHYSVITGLLAGNWTYEAAGLLDADHVRCFTRREIEKLLFRTGFQPEGWGLIPGTGYQAWSERGKPGEVRIDGLQIGGLMPQEAEEFYVYQYLLTARPVRRRSLDVSSALPDQSAQLDQFASQHAWPSAKPDVPFADDPQGWLGDGAREILQRTLHPNMKVVLELGSWLGLSTRFIADLVPQARVIAIDHWRGSPEHLADPLFANLIPRLFETFLARNWEYRRRVIPVRASTEAGLRAVHAADLRPDWIYVDADHSYESVRADIALCEELFPQAVLVGDDYDAPEVKRAVDEFAAARGYTAQVAGTTWRGWQIVRPSSIAVAVDGLTSIILVTFNEIAFTRECLDSLRMRTDEPYELICVDNGSTDGTPEYLHRQPDVRVIANATNRGFPAAVNQGIAAARGTQVLLLNNDTVVTTGWLRRMLDALHTDPKIGLVGPCSNFVSGPQEVSVGYSDLSALDGFAWDWGKQFRGVIENTDRLVGFCLLIRRELIDRIGTFDERFGIGCFEDDDFTRRAIGAGYRAVIARDSFVHHYGSRSFVGNRVDMRSLMDENLRKFEEKWRNEPTAPAPSAPAGAAAPVPIHPAADVQGADPASVVTQTAPASSTNFASRFVLERSPTGGLQLKRRTVLLSLCMIVRDNERTIRAALESIRPYVDEIIIVDTGSTDRTIEICREFGARIYHFPWIDDFAAARNESNKYATGEWIFWMDSDDTIPPECGKRLRELVEREHPPHVMGYIVKVHCPKANDPYDVTVVDHLKLFRNRPEFRWEGRIHEQILPSIKAAGGDYEFTDIYVVHSGAERSPEGLRRKLERDFRILRKDLEDRPEHPFVLFNLGMTCIDAGQWDEAAGYLQRSIKVSQPTHTHTAKAYVYLVTALMQCKRLAEAEEKCRSGVRRFPDDPELRFRMAYLLQQTGRHGDAIEAYRSLLELKAPRRFASVSIGLQTYVARQNLAATFEAANRHTEAEQTWRALTAEIPEYLPGWRGLGELLIRQKRFDELRRLAEELARRGDPWTRESHILQARALEELGDIDGAAGELERADAIDPPDPEPLLLLTQLLLMKGNAHAAEPALLETLRRNPDDSSALHNLGAIRREQGNLLEAEILLRRSILVRPDSVQTRMILTAVLLKQGRDVDAAAEITEARRMQPDVDVRSWLKNLDVAPDRIPE